MMESAQSDFGSEVFATVSEPSGHMRSPLNSRKLKKCNSMPISATTKLLSAEELGDLSKWPPPSKYSRPSLDALELKRAENVPKKWSRLGGSFTEFTREFDPHFLQVAIIFSHV
jgi:hypothetical protein